MKIVFNPLTGRFDFAGGAVSLLNLKGQVAAVGNLPSSGNTIGDVWQVVADLTFRVWDGVTWDNLGTFQGPAGQNIELQRTATHIQWRVVGGTWANLVALSDITGPPGTSFDPANPGAIGGTTPAAGSFTSLSASTSLLLPNGAPGTPAARNLYQVSDTLRYRDSTNAERLLLNATDNLANLGSTATARNNLGLSALATASVGSGLSLIGGVLSATGGGGGGASFQGYATGNWIFPQEGQLAGGNALAANQIVLSPFTVRRTITIDNIGARVNTGVASTTVDLAIYGSSNGLYTGLPLATANGLSTATVGNISSAITSITLQAGVIYWGAINSNGAPAMSIINGQSTYYANIFGSSLLSEVFQPNGSMLVQRVITQTYGTWPDLTGVASNTFQNARFPALALRISALP